MPPPLDPLACAFFVLLAIVPAGLVHSFWLRSRLASTWKIPLDRGRSWRGRRWLGDNKTWAGMLALPPAAALTFALLRTITLVRPAAWAEGVWQLSPLGYALLGAWTGLGFMAGELPNSFVKRQCGVEPGVAPRNWLGRAVGFVIDRTDSLMGALLAQAMVVPIDWRYAGYLLLVGPGVHWLFSGLLYLLGVKRRAS